MSLAALRRAVLGYFRDSTTDALSWIKTLHIVGPECDGFCQIKEDELKEALEYLKL